MRNRHANYPTVIAIAAITVWLCWTPEIVGQSKGRPAGRGKSTANAALGPWQKGEIRQLKALDSEMRADFKQISMRTVLDFLEEKTKEDLLFVVDRQAFKQEGMDIEEFRNAAVNKQFKKIKVRMLLRLMLEEHGMSYYLDDGRVMITPAGKGRESLLLKVHDITGLLDPKHFERDKVELETALKMLDGKFSFVSRASDSSSGPSAAFLPQRKRLIVRHTLEMQVEIDHLLAKLRGLEPVVDLSGVNLDARFTSSPGDNPLRDIDLDSKKLRNKQ